MEGLPLLARLLAHRAPSNAGSPRGWSISNRSPMTKIVTSSRFAPLSPEHIRIGISRSVPRGLARGFRLYRRLAPGPWFRSIPDPQEWLARYRAEVLDPLDPEQTVAELLRITGAPYPHVRPGRQFLTLDNAPLGPGGRGPNHRTSVRSRAPSAARVGPIMPQQQAPARGQRAIRQLVVSERRSADHNPRPTATEIRPRFPR